MARRYPLPLLRKFHTVVVSASISLGLGVPIAAQASLNPLTDDLVGFDSEFREGQSQANRGEHLSAARTWSRAVDKLSESPENRANRAAVYGYIAEAYQATMLAGAGEDIAREGLKVLDAYAAECARRYPGEVLPARVTEIRDELRAVIDAADKARAPVEPAPRLVAAPAVTPKPASEPGHGHPDPAPLAKPSRGLMITSGVVLAGGVAMLGVFAGGLGRMRAAQQAYGDPANGCPGSTGPCAAIERQGQTMGRVATAGIVAAPVLLIAGAVMLHVALKRKGARRTIAPMLSPSIAGFVWEQRF